jgi:hypothetical protein
MGPCAAREADAGFPQSSSSSRECLGACEGVPAYFWKPFPKMGVQKGRDRMRMSRRFSRCQGAVDRPARDSDPIPDLRWRRRNGEAEPNRSLLLVEVQGVSICSLLQISGSRWCA